MEKKNIIFRQIILLISIVLVAGLGSIFVNLGMDWFNALTKPTQWIPNIVIPIVWTVVYLSFLVLLFLYQRKNILPQSTIIYLAINGFLNVIWCLVFFALNLTFLGNIVIILNLIFAWLLIFDIKKTNKIYYYILSLYPVWISIATTLNLALWILN